MAVQWTVSFDKDALDAEGLEVLGGYEHEVYKGARIDMEEGEFFNFREDMAPRGLPLPTDGGDSWGKHR